MEEKTKEIKDLKDIEKVITEEETISEETIEEVEDINNDVEVQEEARLIEEEPIVEEVLSSGENTSDNPKSNKKLFITIGIISSIIVILLISLIVVLLMKKKPKEVENTSDKSPFVSIMEQALEDGSLEAEINKGLKSLTIKADTIKLLYIDIDSDSKNEVVAYAEEGDKKGLIQLEINDDVYYEDSYPMESIDALGYAYDSSKNTNIWYTLKDKNYTLISSAKKIIKEEIFLESFFILANTYKEKSILQNGIDYKMGKDLNLEKLEKSSLTNEELLKDNNLKKEDIKEVYDKYLKEKKEKEEEEKKEEEDKARAEREKQKLEGRLQLGNISYHFGTYNILSADGTLEGTLMIYSDNTCVHKGVNCTYTIETITPSDDEMIPIISLSTGHIYKPAAIEGELTNREETVTVKYAG